MASPIRLPSRSGRSLFIDNVAPQTRLLEKRRQMFEVQEALEAQKEEYARREEAFKRREEGLRKKDLDLQEALIRFNQILTENEAKKHRAEKRAGEEARATVVKEQEMNELEQQLAALRQETRDLETEMAGLERYHAYMDVFQGAYAEEYSEVATILERYDTLTSAHGDLLAEQHRIVGAVEEERRRLARLQKTAANQQLTGENLVIKMKDRLEEVHSRVHRLLQGMEDSALAKSERSLEVGQILQSVFNLHARCKTSAHGTIIRHTPADVDALEAVPEEAQGTNVSEPAVSPVSPELSSMGDLSTLDAAAVRERIREVIGLIGVVGSYVVDFDAITKDYPEYQAEQKRKHAEREAIAQVEQERLRNARAVSLRKQTDGEKARSLVTGIDTRALDAGVRVGKSGHMSSTLTSHPGTASTSSTTAPAQAKSGQKVYLVKGAVMSPQIAQRMQQIVGTVNGHTRGQPAITQLNFIAKGTTNVSLGSARDL